MCSGLCVGRYNTAYLCQEWIDFPQACLPTVSQHCMMRQPGLNLSGASLGTTGKRRLEKKIFKKTPYKTDPFFSLSPQEPVSSPDTRLDKHYNKIHHQHRRPSGGIQRAIAAILITFPTSWWVYYNPVCTPELSAWTELSVGRAGFVCFFLFIQSPLLINDVLDNLLSAVKLIQHCCLRHRQRWWTTRAAILTSEELLLWSQLIPIMRRDIWASNRILFFPQCSL